MKCITCNKEMNISEKMSGLKECNECSDFSRNYNTELLKEEENK